MELSLIISIIWLHLFTSVCEARTTFVGQTLAREWQQERGSRTAKSVQTIDESVANPSEGDEEEEFLDEHGSPELRQKASMIVGVFFVPGILLLYVFCRYVPDKIIDACQTKM